MISKTFWQSKTLSQMSHQEWESLCDGCGLCCLNKFIDDDDDALYYTNIACHLLDCSTGKCRNYEQRKTLVPDCIQLNLENIEEAQTWLPETCAYKRLYNGKALPAWHPLVTKKQSLGYSVANRCISEREVDEVEEYIVPLSHFKCRS